MAANQCTQHSRLHTITLDEPADLQDFFAYTGKDIPSISGHRGGAKNGYPENSIASMRYTLRHTPATFEVDPRLTRDSVIVLMHDATLERTTNATAKVSDYKWEELQDLKLKNSNGNMTEHRIPSLDEAIRWARGKTVLNLDIKDVPKLMYIRAIGNHNAESYVIVTVRNAEQAKYYYERAPHIMFSAWIKTKEAFDEYDQAVPWEQVAQAYIGPRITPENKKLIELLHDQGVMVMVGAGPSQDKLPDDERADAYRALIRSGVDIIETDRPVESAKAIQPLIPEDSPKQRFFE
ncbi:MAG TPA: glycerophosphodiester phosphodiesterase family protein [Fodinibius sp.]|nr:glycerophosphodiester phosphodiesterase family protein [Fodinibius sp.]